MAIHPISVQALSGTIQPNENKKVTPSEVQETFSSLLKKAVNEVNHAQVQSDIMTEKLANGENVQLHDVMIASQKASIMFETALQVRNKVVEAYQSIMRMQI